MKKTIISTFAIITLSAPLAWGTCDNQNCHDAGPTDVEVVPGDTVPATPGLAPLQNMGTPRSGTINDFVTPAKPQGNGGGSDGAHHDLVRPQENLRAPEKACDTPNCR